MSFTGVVLAGGSSARMGTDKATLVVRGRPLAVHALEALLQAGAREVVCIGGDLSALAALGFEVHADEHPGQGPLGGLVAGLRQARQEIVVVLACDLPWASAVGVEAVLSALSADDAGEDDAAVPMVDGRLQPLHAAYRRRCLGPLEAEFAAGERSPTRALRRLRVGTVALAEPRWAADVDTPGDVSSLLRE